jgi:hypothetical protein
MTKNFIFVHGTGVRQVGYDQTFQIIQKQIEIKDKSCTLNNCYWGDECGSKLNSGGLSIPSFANNRSNKSKSSSDNDLTENLTEEEYELGLWTLLYQDPCFELEILSFSLSESESANEDRKATLNDRGIGNFQLDKHSDLKNKLEDEGISKKLFEQAKTVIIENANLIGLPQERLEEYPEVIARALIAQSTILMAETYGIQSFSLTGTARDQLVKEIQDKLIKPEGTDKNLLTEALTEASKFKDLIIQRIQRALLNIGLNNVLFPITTDFVRRYRGEVSEESAATIGDIIMYQCRGQKIRNFIRQQIEVVKRKNPKEPIILLAHSLGGIACVDLFLEPYPPQIDLLVTIGSQAPLFYEWNALVSMAYVESGAFFPDSFPKHWLNIYDERDFLSYKAAEVFPPDKVKKVKVEDFLADNGQPFPASHGGYWKNSSVWDKIFDKINEL